MDKITTLLSTNFLSVAVGVFVILFGLKEIIDIVSYFKKKFRITTGSEEDIETVEKRINVLEKHDKWQYDEISKISRGIDDIKKQLNEKEIADNIRTVATLRSQLYSLHEKFILRGYIDCSGLKTFMELGNIYEIAGGDDIYHDKLKPEILELPIKEDFEM